MLIGKVAKQPNMTLTEFIKECRRNEKVFYLTKEYFIMFDKENGIKVMPLRKREVGNENNK